MILVDISKFHSFDITFLNNSRVEFFAVNGFKSGKKVFGKDVFVLPDVGSRNVKKYSLNEIVAANTIYEMVREDENVQLLFERSSKTPLGTGLKFNEIKVLIFSCFDYLVSKKAESVWLYATPHNIRSYVLSLVCRFLDIPVFYLTESLFDWRFRLVKTTQVGSVTIKSGDAWGDFDQSLFIDLHTRVTSNTPHELLVAEQKGKNLGKFSMVREIAQYWRRPDLIYNKLRCLRMYNKLSFKKEILDYTPFFVFALHYQPERSTLPEGGVYVDQLCAIMHLRQFLPQDIHIFVKEHPATFLYDCHWLTRNPRYYEFISNLEGVSLLPIETSVLSVLKYSEGSASVNGTTCLESIILRKPTIFFSEARFVEDESKFLNSFKNLVCNKVVMSERENPDIDFDMISQGTFSVVNDSKFDVNSVAKFDQIRFQTWAKCFSLLN